MLAAHAWIWLSLVSWVTSVGKDSFEHLSATGKLSFVRRMFLLADIGWLGKHCGR